MRGERGEVKGREGTLMAFIDVIRTLLLYVSRLSGVRLLRGFVF